MRKIEGPNGPIWLRTFTTTIKISGPILNYWQQRLPYSIKCGDTVTVDYSLLPPQSSKDFEVECPLCSKSYTLPASVITRKGHTYCKDCLFRINRYGYLIGQKIGRLTITGIAKPNLEQTNRNMTKLTATCDCGNKLTILGQSIKDSIRSNHVSSCGCYHLELITQIGKNNTGENNPMYRHDMSDDEREELVKKRRDSNGLKWTKSVRGRDQSCIVCGATIDLDSHHLYSYRAFPQIRYEVGNGVTLCKHHHEEFHIKFMQNQHEACTASHFYDYLERFHYWYSSRIKELILTRNLFN